MKKCIVCDKPCDPQKPLQAHDVYFCSQDCLKEYEKKVDALKKVVDWDECC